jgi:hypothetical protein
MASLRELRNWLAAWPEQPAGNAAPRVPKAADGLDEMSDHSLQGLASEYEVPGARDKSRDQLIGELRAAGATSPAARREARAAEVKDRVRVAYLAAVAKGSQKPGGFVSIADIRDELPDIDRGELDDALKGLDREAGVHVFPVANLKSLTARERAAAVRFGNEDSHAISMTRPATKPTTRRQAGEPHQDVRDVLSTKSVSELRQIAYNANLDLASGGRKAPTTKAGIIGHLISSAELHDRRHSGDASMKNLMKAANEHTSKAGGDLHVPKATSGGGDHAAKMAELNAMSKLDARDALDSMTRQQVYDLAKHLGEKGASKHRKRELVDLVLTHHTSGGGQ